ncbi:MAG: dephospho-CoA kinase [Dermatophilaceae bacterium]|nr:dephospho-CoA kinase [Intrasporangiaceae bacterium]
MLRVGLTGGIGSGKSTVAQRLSDHGATIVDADQIAREVVEPGTRAYGLIVRRFGDSVVTPDGALDRPALGRIVFGDPAALADLEGITHPEIWEVTATRIATARRDGIVVHDMPILVEKSLTSDYHLVVVVDTPQEERVRRLVVDRGMTEEDARNRMAAQATDAQRYAAADAILPNTGTIEDLRDAVDALWTGRIAPFDANLRLSVVSRRPDRLTLSEPQERWADDAARLIGRIRTALGERALSAEHVGSTAIPGLVAKDVIDLQIGIRDLHEADTSAFIDAMAAAGFPRASGHWWDSGADGKEWPKRVHGNADPARVAHIHVREHGSDGWIWALRFRDWMRADDAARERYSRFKQELSGRLARTADYAAAKEPWFARAHSEALSWSARTGWRPPR